MSKPVFDSQYRLSMSVPYVPVALGADCKASWQIRAQTLHTSFYPFHWVTIHNPWHVTTLVKTRFDKFLLKEDMTVQPYKGMFWMWNKRWDMGMPHHFKPEDWEEKFDGAVAQMERRVKRFYAVLEGDQPVLFIRQYATMEWATDFVDYIASEYPRLFFKLALVQNRPHQEWADGGRIAVFAVDEGEQWVGDIESWGRVFSYYGLRRRKPDRWRDRVIF